MDVSHSEDEGAVVEAEGSDDDDDGEDAEVSDEDASEAEDGEPSRKKRKPNGCEQDSSEKIPLSLEERREKAKLISSTRILSQKEFAKVREAQLAKKVDAALPKR